MSDGKINSHSESHQRNVEKVEGGGIYTPFPLSTQGGGGVEIKLAAFGMRMLRIL